MSSTTTWSDLPVEMVSEVIKYLDFKSRMMLRGTSRLEKAIVESTKMRFDRVDVNGSYEEGPYVFVVGCDGVSEEQFGGFGGQREKLVALTTSLMKYTKIKTFQLSAAFDQRHFMEDSIDFLEQVTERGGKFKFPVFNVNHFNDNDFQRAFELCDPGIKNICICGSPKLGFERIFRDPVTLPVVLGASIIQINEFDDHMSWIKVIMEAWIKNNQVVGKKVLVWIASYDYKNKWLYERDDQPKEEVMVEEFKGLFEERGVEETAKAVRIRMDNTENQILMRILEEEDDDLTGNTRVVAIWEVIPADLAENGYTKNSGFVYVYC